MEGWAAIRTRLAEVCNEAAINWLISRPFSSVLVEKFFGGNCLSASVSVGVELKVFLNRGSAPSLTSFPTMVKSPLPAARWRILCKCK